MDKVLNTELSEEITQKIGKKNRNPFARAYQATLVTEEAIYVQGFLVWKGEPYRPVECAWIELEDCLVDLNLSHLHKSADQLYYFAAHKLTAKQLKAAIEEAEEDYPDDDPLPVYGETPYAYYGDVMLGGEEYELAYQEALKKCRELNSPIPKE
ncbi:MAG: hypothetical protein SAJ37_03610 [Oscillatoria sp. PMC 1068.18]|nr:hypothetical protein [Oscillatoria sp. PMC 1076.18]MEC4987814.1 hypothetical protein [Oscillatoria sp. PMC 1068.18]